MVQWVKVHVAKLVDPRSTLWKDRTDSKVHTPPTIYIHTLDKKKKPTKIRQSLNSNKPM